MSANLAPLHHCNTASIISTLKLWTYSSSTTAIPLSLDTLAIHRARSWSCRSGAARSSFSLTCVVDCHQHTPLSTLTFSWNAKQLSRAAQSSGLRGLKVPPNMSSVNKSSSPLLISHATRPFISTTSSFVVKPSRRKTRFRDFNSSSCKTSWTELIFRLRFLTLSMAFCLRS